MTDELPEGISWHPAINMWRADAKIGKKHYYLGSRETISAASQLYQELSPAVYVRHHKQETTNVE